MTCNVTGTAISPNGQIKPGAKITFRRAQLDVVSQEGSFVIPDDYIIQTALDGTVDFDILPGVYDATTVAVGGRTVAFRVSVPDEPAADFSDLLNASYVEIPPASVTQSQQARDAAIAARDVAVAARDEALLYDGPKVDTFAELASVTPTQLAVGEYIRVIATGAVYQRVSTGGDLDYTGSGGVRLVVLPVGGMYRARDFGAVMDGVTDDIAVIEKARDAVLARAGNGVFALDLSGGITAISRPLVLFPNGAVWENIELTGHIKAVGSGWAKRVDDLVLNTGSTTGDYPQRFETLDYMIRLTHDYGTAETGKPLNVKVRDLVLDCGERCNGLLVANGEGIDIESPFIHSFLEAGITFKNNNATYGTRGTDIFLRVPRIYRKKTTTLLGAENETLYTGGQITGYGIYSSGQDVQIIGGVVTSKVPIYNERGSVFLSGVHVWCLGGPATVPGASDLARWQNWLAFHSGLVASNIVMDGQTYFDDCVPVIRNSNGSVNLLAGQITVREDDAFGGLGAAVVFDSLTGGGDTLTRCRIGPQVEFNVSAEWNTVGTKNGVQIAYLAKSDINAGDLYTSNALRLLRTRIDCYLTLTAAQATDNVTVYSAGTIAVTNGSRTVTGTSTLWTQSLVGKSIIIGGVTYTVAFVSSRTSLELEFSYSGATASGLSYTIQSGYHKFRWSFAEWSNKDYTPGVTTFTGTINNAPRLPLQVTVPVRVATLTMSRASSGVSEAHLTQRLSDSRPFAVRVANDQWDVYWPAGIGGDMILTGWRTNDFDGL